MRLRITAHLANGTALPTASFIEGKLAAALGVDVSQVRVLEKFAQREPAAVIVTLDLYSTSARPAAASAARLAGLVVRRSPLLGTLRPLEFDAAAGLEQLTPDGTVRVRPATSDGPPPAVPGAPRGASRRRLVVRPPRRLGARRCRGGGASSAPPAREGASALALGARLWNLRPRRDR